MDDLLELLRGRRVLALTGAGCSTESGIPDYRGDGTRRRARAPVQHAQFVRSAEARRRYWARAVIGWPKFSAAAPNAGHAALAALERAGAVTGVITQNVDRLHHAAGSRRVIELHGSLYEVRCLACGALSDRAGLQARLLELNPGWAERSATLNPDGDADLDGEALKAFRVLDCPACGGVLKPNVVFFGEGVPRPVVEAAYARVEAADVLLVLGSSLAVFSGFRFVRRAAERGIPVCIVNRGETRGDPYAACKLDAPLGEILPALADALPTLDVARPPLLRRGPCSGSRVEPRRAETRARGSRHPGPAANS